MHARNAAGFTLVELMIVVAIMAVLAVVAVVAYTRYLRNSRMVEAHEMLGQIQLRQESYFEARGQYMDVSAGTFYPTPTPNNFEPKPWATPPPGDWGALGIRVDRAQTYFSYSVRAGAPAGGFALVGRAAALGLVAGRPWFYAVAQADMDMAGPPDTEVIVTSLRRQPVVMRQGQ